MAYIWFLIFLLVVTYWLLTGRKQLNIPGPRGLPIVGCIFQVDGNRPHITITNWAKTYGPVFAVRMFQTNTIFLNSYDTIYDVLVKRGDIFRDRALPYRLKIYSNGNRGIQFSTSFAPHWQIMRNTSQKYMKLNISGSREMEDLVCDVIYKKMETFSGLNGIPVEIRTQIYRFALSIMHVLTFGEDLKDDEFTEFKEFEENLTTNIAVSGEGMLLDEFPWLRFFFNSVYKKLKNACDLRDKMWARKKNEFHMLRESDRRSSLMKKLMKLQHDTPVVDDMNIKICIFDLVAAGSTTTTATLSAFILILLHHPHIQSKLQQEVDRVMGRGKRVTLAKRDEMPYTRAAIFEVLRYTSVVSLGVPRVAVQDTTINGSFVPKGTVVAVNLWMLHHEADFWGDPWNYRPERFLDETGSLMLPDHPNRKRLLPFGAGYRVCLGEVFALNRIFLFVAALMQKFDVYPDREDKLPSCDPRTYVPGMTIHPPAFNARLLPRRQ